MPELPEVETIRRDLNAILSGKKIKQANFKQSKMVRPSVKRVRESLVKNVFTKVARRGKMLVFYLKKGGVLLVHLKMTGQLVWRPVRGKMVVGGHPIVGIKSVPNKFTHVTISFTDGSKLYFNDMRRFGYWRLVAVDEFLELSKHDFGLEPLTSDFSIGYFKSKLKSRGRSLIKSILLDQKVVAGVGNIYADESLWAAKLKPTRRVSSLKDQQLVTLVKAVKKILWEAVKYRGTSFDSYVDSYGRVGSYWPHRKVYARNGLTCRRCGNIILKARVAGRGTHYCPKCQK